MSCGCGGNDDGGVQGWRQLPAPPPASPPSMERAPADQKLLEEPPWWVWVFLVITVISFLREK